MEHHHHHHRLQRTESTVTCLDSASANRDESGIAESKPHCKTSDIRNSKRKRCSSFDANPKDDGYQWHKYGQKILMGTSFLRAYYRCAQKSSGCRAKKLVDSQNVDDNNIVNVTYDGEHNHHPTMYKDWGRSYSNSKAQLFTSSPSCSQGRYFSSPEHVSSSSCIDCEDKNPNRVRATRDELKAPDVFGQSGSPSAFFEVFCRDSSILSQSSLASDDACHPLLDYEDLVKSTNFENIKCTKNDIDLELTLAPPNN